MNFVPPFTFGSEWGTHGCDSMRKTLLIYFSKKFLVDDQEVAPAIRAPSSIR
jgi:hypothetical protein